MAVNLVKLHETPMNELVQQAQELGVNEIIKRRGDLVFAIARAQGSQANQDFGRGVLEVHSEGFGFLRSPDQNFLPGPDDIYVSQSQIRRFKLQTGDTVIGLVRPPKEGERYTALLRVESVNGDPPGVEPPTFESLTAIYPDDKIDFAQNDLLKPVEAVAPMGLGQRALLVAPPRTGRVDLLRALADALSGDDELEVCVLLIGERPEEIHEWRSKTSAEVIATPFDDQASRHVQVAEIVFERARRMVERGDDVVLILESLNRLLSACTSEVTNGSKSFNEVDMASLSRVRRFLGSARALEEGGSLTIIGTISSNEDNVFAKALISDLEEVVNWRVHLLPPAPDQQACLNVDASRSGSLRSERLSTSK